MMNPATATLNPTAVSELPAARQLPLLRQQSADAHAFMWEDDFHLIISQLAKKHGNIYAVETSKGPLVVLTEYHLIKEALVNQSHIFNIRADFEILKIAPQKHFLELEAGPAWALHRKVFAEAMRDYFSSRWQQVEDWMTTEINDIVTVWRAQGPVVFDPNREVSVKLASFLHKVMFDERFGPEEKRFFDEKSLSWLPNGFINSTRYELLAAAEQADYQARYGEAIEKFSTNLNGLDAYVSMNVERRQASFQPGHFRDLTDYLLAANLQIPAQSKAETGIGDREILVGSLTQVAGAGGGVGAFAMRWALLYLAAYPHYQQLVQQELDRVVGRHQIPQAQHKADLPYTQAFLSEVLRHCSITAMPAANYAASADTELAGYRIAKGTPFVISNYSMTRDPALWLEPEVFNPARFLDENGELSKKQQGKAFPFGLGQRRCLGENFGKFIIHTLFTQLVHQFEFSLPAGSKTDLRAISGVFLVPAKVELIATAR